MQTLERKELIIEGFKVVLSLVDYQCGWSSFNNKWVRDQDGLVKSNDNHRQQNWDCTWYSIGQLNKGHDVTVASAQKEFKRDCNAFDVGLIITVSKSDIELVSDHVIGSDYSYDDDYSTLQVLEYLYNDYGDDASEQIEQAKAKLKELVEC